MKKYITFLTIFVAGLVISANSLCVAVLCCKATGAPICSCSLTTPLVTTTAAAMGLSLNKAYAPDLVSVVFGMGTLGYSSYSKSEVTWKRGLLLVKSGIVSLMVRSFDVFPWDINDLSIAAASWTLGFLDTKNKTAHQELAKFSLIKGVFRMVWGQVEFIWDAAQPKVAASPKSCYPYDDPFMQGGCYSQK